MVSFLDIKGFLYYKISCNANLEECPSKESFVSSCKKGYETEDKNVHNCEDKERNFIAFNFELIEKKKKKRF